MKCQWVCSSDKCCVQSTLPYSVLYSVLKCFNYWQSSWDHCPRVLNGHHPKVVSGPLYAHIITLYSLLWLRSSHNNAIFQPLAWLWLRCRQGKEKITWSPFCHWRSFMKSLQTFQSHKTVTVSLTNDFFYFTSAYLKLTCPKTQNSISEARMLFLQNVTETERNTNVYFRIFFE